MTRQRSRKVEATDPKQNKYINIGGTFRMNKKRIIKPNEEFFALPHEIPKAFSDVIKLVEKNTKAAKAKDDKSDDNVPLYEKKQKEDSELFCIVDNTGKVINDTDLTEKEADGLLTQLNG